MGIYNSGTWLRLFSNCKCKKIIEIQFKGIQDNIESFSNVYKVLFKKIMSNKDELTAYYQCTLLPHDGQKLTFPDCNSALQFRQYLSGKPIEGGWFIGILLSDWKGCW